MTTKKNDGLSLGIDLGGSKIYAVVTDADNTILSRAKIPTPANADPEKLAEGLVRTGKEALEALSLSFGDVSHIGAAVPSPVDPETGDCHFATNLAVKQFSLKDLLRERFGQEVYLGNDGNLGLLSEVVCGSAANCRNAVGFFIGTGLGGGLFINGKLLVGNCGLAGELGHMIVRKGGRLCGCGHKGCAEAYCSKMAYVKAIHKYLARHKCTTLLPADKFHSGSVNIKSKYLRKAYLEGDRAVCAAVDKGSEMLGIAAADVCAAVAPECVVLGGGVVAALGDQIMPVFRESFERHLFGIPPEKIKLLLSKLGDDAVALGAAIYAAKKGRV
ncbi:MAG: ROK family protein [Lentisphaeria bacterium]|nr:ROK family protein [Lentisphaeria bacterium]